MAAFLENMLNLLCYYYNYVLYIIIIYNVNDIEDRDVTWAGVVN